MITLKVHAKQKRQIDLSLTQRVHKDAIKRTLFEGGDLVVRRDKELISSGQKSGRLYFVKGQSHRASAPGQAPANRTGRLLNSTDFNVRGSKNLIVGQSAEYAKFLEDGTKNMAARPNLIRAINETSGEFVSMFYDNVGRQVK